MTITTKTNGYEIGRHLETMVKRFETVMNEYFPDWEVEHFYYGSKLVMTTVKGCGCEYAEFNISAIRVSLNGCTCTRSHHKLFESFTYNDECHEGKLLELVNF
jgi:hypothetical protein